MKTIVAIVAGVISLGLSVLIYSSVNKNQVPSIRIAAWPRLPGDVGGIAFDGRSIWLTLDGEGVIYEVSPEDGSIRRRIAFFSTANGGSAWDGHFLWQVAYQDKTISKVDVSSGRIVKSIRTPGNGQCSGMTFDGHHLWVANFDDEQIYEIDQDGNGEVLRSIDSYFETTGLAWDGKFLWSGVLVTARRRKEEIPRTGFVEQVDLQTQEAVRAIPIAGAGSGTSDWLPGGTRAKRFWWYDAYHRRVLKMDISGGP